MVQPVDNWQINVTSEDILIQTETLIPTKSMNRHTDVSQTHSVGVLSSGAIGSPHLQHHCFLPGPGHSPSVGHL